MSSVQEPKPVHPMRIHKPGSAVNNKRIPAVRVMHFVRLAVRVAVLILVLVCYILYRIRGGVSMRSILGYPIIYVAVWAYFVVEMLLRFFPSKLDSPGSQKVFSRNYIPTNNPQINIEDNNAVLWTAIVWIAFNLIFGALYLTGIIDEGIMLLICSAFAVCDMICILFFCPFQKWFLKNRCCCTCRIYNWDYAMMFTPLIFIQKPYAWVLVALSAAYLLRWEVAVLRHPERFAKNTNGYLACSNCTEKGCALKKPVVNKRITVIE